MNLTRDSRFNIIEKAKNLLEPIGFEPHTVAYFVTQDNNDIGTGDFCIDCIKKEVKRARKHHQESRQNILNTFKNIKETGFYNGKNIKERYSDSEINKIKKRELKKYPSKTTFGYKEFDPSFASRENTTRVCESCGAYFYINYEPNSEECNYLIAEYGDGLNIPGYLKWLLTSAFDNWQYLDSNAQNSLLLIAKKIIKNNNLIWHPLSFPYNVSKKNFLTNTQNKL